jgi:hypothetical protein
MPILLGIVASVASAILAQLAEHVTCNLGVPGSIPGDGSRVLSALFWGDSRVVKGGRL